MTITASQECGFAAAVFLVAVGSAGPAIAQSGDNNFVSGTFTLGDHEAVVRNESSLIFRPGL